MSPPRPLGDAPDLTLVVFTRDDAEHLHNCLECLRNHPPAAVFELIVVDNASRDGTAETVALAGRAGLAVQRVALATDTSFSAGNNLALRKARGRATLFLNPDTLPEGPLLDRCLRVLRDEPRAGLVGPRLRYPDGAWQGNGWALPTPARLLAEHVAGVARELPPRASGAGEPAVTEVGWLMGCFLLGDTEFLREINGFDESFWFHGTDLELCARVAARGRRVLRVEDCELTHHGHRRWTKDRRRLVHEALLRWLRRDHGPLPAAAVGAAARLAEALRR
jgi:GT2 family glycosyltransferase